MKEKLLAVGVVALAFVVAASIAVLTKTGIRRVEKQPPVRYRIVKGGRIGDVVSMEVVVDPEITKEQALELGDFLREKYLADCSHVDIGIFDDLHCAVGRFSASIPQEQFFQHYLVQVSIDRSSNLANVEWVKK